MADRRSIVRWNRNADINSFTTSLRDAQETLRENILAVVYETVLEGAEAMREAIRTDNQTSWVGDGPVASQGRQDYGLFLDGITEEVDEYSTIVRGFFGWWKDSGNWDDAEGSEWLNYFGYQEHGFWHVNAGKWIPGVQAGMYGAERAKAVAARGMRELSLTRKVSKQMQLGYDPKNTRRTSR